MPATSCRACGQSFFDAPLLRLTNMPKAAQLLPGAAELGADAGIDLTVVQCSGCGLAQLENDPVPYFRDVIRAAAVSEDILASKRAQFGEFIASYGLRGRKIVEIGCGRGDFLALLRECGVEASGVEHQEEAVRNCRERGLRVQQGFVGDRAARLDHAPFDAFLILMFLEHLPDPRATLAGIRGNLAAGAVGLVEVPNFDMVLRHQLFSEFIADHLCCFTRETLERTLSSSGFDVLECREERYEYVLSAVVRKRAPLDLGDFRASRETLRREVDDYLLALPGKKVAVWGAGHQALAILSLLDLAGKIRYVVDSAPFKQGRYTPATHIPIVPPEALANDPVDAVIVMAASYSDEVARILREEHDPRLNIAILRSQGLERIR